MANKWGIPKDVELSVLARDEKCVYCGRAFGGNRASQRSWEHIVNDISLATIDNIASCCVGCNASKGAKELRVWLDSDNARHRGISASTLAAVVVAALQGAAQTK